MGDPGLSDTYWLNFLWGLVLLASFTGWGTILCRILKLDSLGVEWGLKASWGMAWTIFAGGWLMLLSAATRPSLLLLVGLGLCGHLANSWTGLRTLHTLRMNRRHVIAAAAFCVALIVLYAPAVSSRMFNVWDDFLAYFPLAKRILDTGTMLEPFSLRRLATFGGQSLLQALMLIVGSDKSMNLIDRGLGCTLLAVLIYGQVRRWTTHPLVPFLVSGAFALFPTIQHNVMSQNTGTFLFLALYCTMDRLWKDWGKRPQAAPVLIGLLVAAICTLRASFVFAAGVFLAVLFVLTLAGMERNAWRALFIEYLRTAAVVAGGILPWMIVLHQSSGTFLYPFVRGNQAPDFIYRSALGGVAQAAVPIGNLLLVFVAPIFWPVVVLPFVLRNRVAMASAFTALIASILLAVSFETSETVHVFRYAHPMLMSALCASFLLVPSAAIGEFLRTRRGQLYLAICILQVPALVGLAMVYGPKLAANVSMVPAEIADTAPLFPASEKRLYRDVQSTLSSSGSMLAVLPLPWLFDYQRSKVLNIDLIGSASPPPGMPCAQGAAALKAYLRAAGIEYLAYSDFDHPRFEYEYLRSRWVERLAGPPGMYRTMSVRYLDFMKNVDELAHTEETVLRREDVRVLRLSDDGHAVRRRGPSTSGTPRETRVSAAR